MALDGAHVHTKVLYMVLVGAHVYRQSAVHGSGWCICTHTKVLYMVLAGAQALGTKLVIGFGKQLSEGDECQVVINFSTMPKSTALQFLEPSQTAGGQHPYLFTQCQAIHARSFVPCQVSEHCCCLPCIKCSAATLHPRVYVRWSAMPGSCPTNDPTLSWVCAP